MRLLPYFLDLREGENVLAVALYADDELSLLALGVDRLDEGAYLAVGQPLSWPVGIYREPHRRAAPHRDRHTVGGRRVFRHLPVGRWRGHTSRRAAAES